MLYICYDRVAFGRKDAAAGWHPLRTGRRNEIVLVQGGVQEIRAHLGR